MNNKDYLPRLIDKKIEKVLKAFGAVCIQGPKWCGKTWTSRFHSKSEISLGDPGGNFQNKTMAELNPDLVLIGEIPRLIDEWQEVPSLWDAVRFEVDKRGKKGQFILTGSSTPQQKGILHSGAGRIATMNLRPMSLFESGDSSGQVSLMELFEDELKSTMVDQIDLKNLIDLVIRGGWPGSLKLKYEEFSLVTKSYLEAIVNHDIYRLEGINRDSKKMSLLLKSLARNESTVASISKLIKDITEYEGENIDEKTVSEYLSIFERLFLIENQEAFSKNIRSSTRVIQSSKRHFVDPSLAVAALNVGRDELLNDLNTFGFLFEALCERDLRIYAESIDAKLYHYRDYKNNEIDAIVELNDGRWGAFEIKLGAYQIDEAAKSLIKISDMMKADKGIYPDILVVICGICNAAYKRPDGVYVVPITALRP